MTDLQKRELEIFKEFTRICERLDLKYYLVCGSALGAVKYEGFIPWDDDLDVALPRPDYDIFVNEAQKYLPGYMFLQNCHTDPFYPLYMSKIRDSRTTFIENLYSMIPMNHGVYIDVFPLDGYPCDDIEKIIFEKEKVRLNRHRCVRYNYNRFSKQNIIHVKAIGSFLLFKIFGVYKNTSKIITRLETLTAQNKCCDSDLWCNFGNWQGEKEYAPKEQYGDGSKAIFEGIEVIIPACYDEYLSQKYGDWRADLPEDQKVPAHGHFVDLTHPYTDYIVKLKNGKLRLKTAKELLNSGIIPPEGLKY